MDFPPSGNQVSFSKSADAFAFEEDSSSDGLSPDHTRSEDPQGPARSPPDTKATETPLAGPPGTMQVNKPHLSLSPFQSVSLRYPEAGLDGISPWCLFSPLGPRVLCVVAKPPEHLPAPCQLPARSRSPVLPRAAVTRGRCGYKTGRPRWFQGGRFLPAETKPRKAPFQPQTQRSAHLLDKPANS